MSTRCFAAVLTDLQAFIYLWSKMPAGVVLECGAVRAEIEPYMAPCPCGGGFRADAVPRCPHCHQPLSATEAATYIEGNASGTAKGWRWQRDWQGLFAMVIEGREVEDPWDAQFL